MAKSKASTSSRARAAASASPDTEVVISARMSAPQKELVERAADVLGWSPAKLVRDAAVRRAVDVINASGGAEIQLRLLAAKLVEQLVNPKAKVDLYSELANEPYGSSTVTAETGCFSAAGNVEAEASISAVTVLRPSPAERLQMRSALEEAGTRFVQMILSAWDSADGGMGEFKPQISRAHVLGDGDGDGAE